jgi:hypothetical protein
MSRKFHLLFFCFALIAVAVQGFLISTETRQRSQQQAPLLRATKSDVDVAIFGGGFGGLYTALALSREAKAKGKSLDIALIDPSHQFVFTPLLYDLTVGTASPQEVCPKYAEVLRGTGVRHIAGMSPFVVDLATAGSLNKQLFFLSSSSSSSSYVSSSLLRGLRVAQIEFGAFENQRKHNPRIVVPKLSCLCRCDTRIVAPKGSRGSEIQPALLYAAKFPRNLPIVAEAGK